MQSQFKPSQERLKQIAHDCAKYLQGEDQGLDYLGCGDDQGLDYLSRKEED